MRKRTALLIASCLAFAVVASGKYQKLTLTNGRSLVGEVERTEDGYRITDDAGVTATFPDEQVAKVEDVLRPEDEYEQQAEGKDLDDPVERYKLAKWAFDNGYFEIAQREVKAALELREDFELAKLLLEEVEAELAPDPGEERGDDEGDGGGARTRHLMSDTDVNRIRQIEMGKGERLHVAVEDGVIKRFIELQRGRGDFKKDGFEEAFLRWPSHRQADYILEETRESAHEIRDDVVIKRDPEFMELFQRTLWPMLQRNCARAGCHGGSSPASGFRLFPMGGDRVRTLYTNFYLLSIQESGGYRVLDRDYPELSLLLLYGLPRKLSERPHPTEIKAMFTGPEDPKYRAVVDWIDSLDGPPHKGYGVDYEPPKPAEPEEEPDDDAPAPEPAETRPADDDAPPAEDEE